MTNRMTIDDLGQVAGGTLKESSNDSKFLGALNSSCERFGTGMIYWSTQAKKEVIGAWEKCGVRVILSDRNPNEYFIMNTKVSQDEAMKHAQGVVGKNIDRSAWDW